MQPLTPGSPRGATMSLLERDDVNPCRAELEYMDRLPGSGPAFTLATHQVRGGHATGKPEAARRPGLGQETEDSGIRPASMQGTKHFIVLQNSLWLPGATVLVGHHSASPQGTGQSQSPLLGGARAQGLGPGTAHMVHSGLEDTECLGGCPGLARHRVRKGCPSCLEWLPGQAFPH